MNGLDPVLVLARTSAVLAVALVVVLLARRSPALRVAAVRWGMVAAALVAVGSSWWRERPQPVVAVPASMPITLSVPVSQVRMEPMKAASKKEPAAVASAQERTFEVLEALAYLWAAGSLLLSVQLVFGLAVMGRFRRRCERVESPELLGLVARLAEQAGVLAPPVREDEAVAGPFVSGVRRATVYLPKGWAQDADPEVVEAVLRHELAHIANGDLRWGLFGRFVRIVLWPQPLIWLLRKPLAAAEEEACDRQVVASGVSQSQYAAGLLALREARVAYKVPALAIGAVASRSGFGRRIEAIMAFSGKGGVRLSKRGSLAVRIGALGLAALAAFVFARPTATMAAQDDPTLGGLQKSYATKVRVLDAEGKPITGAKAYLVRSVSIADLPAQELKVEGSEVAVPAVESEEDSSGHLAVRVPGYGLGFVRLWPTPKRVTEIRLPASVSMNGNLLLPDGKPAANVRVRVATLLRVRQAPRSMEFLRAGLVPDPALTTVTDDAGMFLFRGLPPKTTVVSDVDDERFAHLVYPVRLDTKETGISSAPSVRLTPGAVIEGRVVRDGKPMAGLAVGAQDNHEKAGGSGGAGDAVTDADGRYRITRLLPSVYNVALDLRGGLENEVTAVAHEAVEVREGTIVSGRDFELIPGTLIEGVVTGPDGKPMSKVHVGVYGPAHPNSSAWVQNTKTDGQGRYRFRVPAGKQMVYMMDGRYEGEQKHVTTRDGVTRVDLRVSGPRKPSP